MKLMTLFDTDPQFNLLPSDGLVRYFGKIIDQQLSDGFYHYLLNKIDWKQDEAIIFGKHLYTKRKAAWYGDKPYAYTYSKTTKVAIPWTAELLELKQLAEKITGISSNSCLLNLYHNGTEGMAYHSDDEVALGPRPEIASFSFGAERKFLFKHKQNGELVSMVLEHGSLLTMEGETQKYWLHRLPQSKKITTPRINLTFRKIFD